MNSLVGKTVVCLEMFKDPLPVPAGTIGTIEYIDDANHIHVKWDNGSCLSLIPGIDRYFILND